MHKFLTLAVAVAILLATIYAATLAASGSARQTLVCLHHEAQGVADQTWTEWRPAASISGHADHQGDYVDETGLECGGPVVPAPTATPGPIVDPVSKLISIFLPIVAEECTYTHIITCPEK